MILSSEFGVNDSWRIGAFPYRFRDAARPCLRGPHDHRARASWPQSFHRRLPRRVDRSRASMAPASRGPEDQYAGRARGGDFHHLWARGLGCGRRDSDCGPGRDRHRLSRRRRDLQGGAECARPQHSGDPLVLGRGRPARWRGDGAPRPHGGGSGDRSECRLAAAGQRHQSASVGNVRGRAALRHLDRMPAGARLRHPRPARAGHRGRAGAQFLPKWTAPSWARRAGST